MTPSARFGITGERYGSTPILTRPGSRLTLYGSSNDIHHQSNSMNNYSLDRKLRSSCPSASSSPRLAMNSLSSLPHSYKLVNYDSLESVGKSPVSNADSSVTHKPSYHISGSNHGSLMDLTPSPSDSGISELEAALRDRDSELAYLRQTMEHNEQVIFKVYQEKEKVWERELKRLKTVQESRLRASAQKVHKLEQMLMMQTYQLQQDKKRLGSDVQRSNMQCDRLRQEVGILRNRLEETEWGLCQKTGEISLLKTQLKESQTDQTNKSQELVQLRNDFRDLKDQVEEKHKEIQGLESSISRKDEEIFSLKEELLKVNSPPPPQYDSLDSINKNCDETDKLRAEIKELREELSEMSLSDYSGVEAGRSSRAPLITQEDSLEDLEIQKFNGESDMNEMEKLRIELEIKTKQFENERLTWGQRRKRFSDTSDNCR
ncbi:hypothetical protein JTB14_033043 [Gonioctena quinquepunctata]|nr:hypothetical protein JTB14_033043 [Gonioctena quinquepunctata]